MGKRGKEGDSKIVPEHMISIVAHMSPQHAKDMACLLLDNISAYEKKFGKINSQFDIEELRIRKNEDADGTKFTPPGGIQA